MIDEERLAALLDELLASQRSPEEVCASCPELLPQVRRRWRQMRRVRAQLDLLFPPSSDGAAHLRHRHPDESVVPIIEGYEIEAVLGRGGMGVVYRARHVQLNRMVALKMLLAGSYAGREELERFLHEAQMVAGLRHPNIVQLYDVANVEGRPYFTMELVEGGSLAHKLSGTPLSALDAANLIAELAAAVETAHRSGIVHRDLKPANVLLNVDGTPKITDFGLARQLDSGLGLTLTGAPLGTPSYMAPEQARGDKKAIGPATDIYSLGAILYECLTGRPPFKAETTAVTLQQVLANEPVSPTRLNPRVPRDLETICLKCLNKDPHRRYASAQELADDLGHFQRGEPIKARPVGPVERAVRWVRRRPTGAALLGVLILTAGLALTLVGGWLWVHGQRVAMARAAEEDLAEAVRLIRQADLAGAFTAAERARGRLGTDGPDELRNRLEQTEQAIRQQAKALDQARALVARLEAIRLNRVIVVKGRQDRAQSELNYVEEFRVSDVATFGEKPEAVAARLAASPLKRELVAALDDWAICTDDVSRRTWLMDVARRADPEAWRNQVRDPDPKAWRDRARLAELASTAPLERESVHLLLALGSRLQDDNGDREAVEFLRRVQRAHPADFFANYMFACSLYETGDAWAAVGHFRAALTVRPDAANAWYGLGLALENAGRLDDAESALRESVKLAPTHGWAHRQLGIVQRKQSKFDEAIDHLRQAVRYSSPAAWMQTELARALQDTKQWEEAIECYRAAARLDPDNPWTHFDLGMALNTPGRQDEAIQHLRKSVSLGPESALTRRALGSALLASDRPDEAVEHFQAAVTFEPDQPTQQVLRTVLIRLGRLEEARATWEKLLQAGPPEHDPWSGYAELCLFLGKEDEFRSTRSVQLARFQDTTDPYIAERVARACLLLPGSEAELRQAAALAERATAAADPKYDWAHPYFHFAKGLADYRRGEFDKAIAVMSSDAKDTHYIGPSSRLVTAMAMYRTGNTDEARTALAAAVEEYDWSLAKADNRDVWIPHILRREAEALILPSSSPQRVPLP